MKPNTPSPTFPAIALPQFENEALPPVLPVALRHPDVPALPDVAAATREALDASQRLAALSPGARVAITCGSRGIRSKPDVVRAAVAWLKGRGLEPFIVPAMGSHGGAVASGQVSLLAELGFTEEAMGCPIEAGMEVVRLSETRAGIPVHFDRRAFAADAVLVVARVKSHTSFDREVESGLTKMVAIGLGKAEGARFVHRLGVRGYMEVLPEWAEIAIREAPVAYGLAIVENARREAATIEGAEPETFYETDARLLKTAKGCIPRLPFEQIDVLAVEQLGKNISGTGMDPAVTARFDIRGRPNPPAPVIGKLVVLGLTPETHGNGLGVGNADYTTKQVADQPRPLRHVHERVHGDVHRARAHPRGARQRQGGAAGRRRHLVAARRRGRQALPDPLHPAPGDGPGLAASGRRARRRRRGAGPRPSRSASTTPATC